MFILPQMFLACVVENGGAFILAISVKNEPLNFHNDARKKRNDQKQKKNISTKWFFQRKKITFFQSFKTFNFRWKKTATSILLIISKNCPSRLLNWSHYDKSVEVGHFFKKLPPFCLAACRREKVHILWQMEGIPVVTQSSLRLS